MAAGGLTEVPYRVAEVAGQGVADKVTVLDIDGFVQAPEFAPLVPLLLGIIIAQQHIPGGTGKVGQEIVGKVGLGRRPARPPNPVGNGKGF